jgi:hypothetical protein
MKKSVYIGYDSPFPQAFAVCAKSVLTSMDYVTPSRSIHGLHLKDLVETGVYTRPIDVDASGRMIDRISAAPMSTEFALSRFLVPHLARTRGQNSGLALFMDCDMLITPKTNILEVFGLAAADRSKAVWVVKHQLPPQREPGDPVTKMDGQIQTWYPRKLWSSFMLFNLDHPAVQRLTPEYVNRVRGLELHQFGWCDDGQIGELPEAWNWLVGMRPEPEGGAKNVHWTMGGPWLTDYEDAPYHLEWNEALTSWVHNPACIR